MTDPLGENRRNAAKEQEKSALKPNQINNSKHNISVLYKRWKNRMKFK